MVYPDMSHYNNKNNVRGQVNFSTYSDLTVQMAVDLVNTLDGYVNEDSLTSVGDLEDFLSQYQRDRKKLRSVFASADETEAADRLNQVLARVKAIPRISVHSAAPHFHFEPARGTTADWLAAATAMSLGVVLCDYGLDRFGICEAEECVDVYVDSSKNRSRRHCSGTCTTRENVAAYRRRARAGSTS